ncbi:MAG: hypothetical protein ABIP94_05705 [Planctomycetota bacterium]
MSTADSKAVTGDGDDGDGDAQHGGTFGAPRDASAAGQKLRRVEGPMGDPEPPTTLRLRREFKGLTVADLLRDEIVERLPGQVRSALRSVQAGDFAAAERALPGEFATVLPGPGHRRGERRRSVLLLMLVAALAAMLASAWIVA